MSGGADAQLATLRGCALELALSVARAAEACAGDGATLVLGDVARGWWAGLPAEARTLYLMTGEVLVSSGALKAS